MEYPQFSDLVGKTLTSVEGKVGDDKIIFTTSAGEKYVMYHASVCWSRIFAAILKTLSDIQ